MRADSERIPVEDLAPVADLFEADRETHLYGLADLDEPFRSHTRWFMSGDAVVGFISTGDDWVAGYAMSQVNPRGTLALLVDVQGRLPGGTWITGPIGLHEAVGAVRPVRPGGRHWRMILENLNTRAGHQTSDLGTDDADALKDLYGSDPGAAFFLPSMLEHGHFVGIRDGGVLVAASGTHVASEARGVAALGAILTRPNYRGRGLGRRVTSALCEQIVGRYETIGLNVAVSNEAAVSLYQEIGFVKRFEYEEIVLL